MSSKKHSLSCPPSMAPILWGFLFFFACNTVQIGNYMSKKVCGLISAILIIVLIFVSKKPRLDRIRQPLPLALLAYTGWAGISTLYAHSGKFAIAEFSFMLTALAVFLFVLLLSDSSAQATRRIIGILACGIAPVGLFSIDAASCNILMRLYRAYAQQVTAGYDDTIGTSFYARLSTVFGNPNLYAGLLSVGCLLAVWLLLTAESKSSRVRCCILLTIQAVSYVLAFSMGSLGVFVIAVLVMLALCPKEKRLSLFLLLIRTGIIGLLTAGVASRGFGDTATGSFLPIIALAIGCALSCASELLLRDRLTLALSAHTRLLTGTIIALLAAAVCYLILALQLSGPFTFNGAADMRRTANLSAGSYTLNVSADKPINIRISYKNTGNLIQNNDTELAAGSSDAPISFTVPEDSRLVFFYFTSAPDVTIDSAEYSGAASGSLHLNYKLLPEFIADRVQDISANGNVVQRGVYRQDAIRLFKTSPIIGRGLGGFENGVVSVQDYHYETTHAHNHYVQVLCDLGIIGLLTFLSVLCAAVWLLLRIRRENALYAMLFAACLVQIFGQALNDLTWSAGCCLTAFYGVFALFSRCLPDPAPAAKPKKNDFGALVLRLPIALYLAVFAVLLGINLNAQQACLSGRATASDMKRFAAIDPFEKNDYKLSYIMSDAAAEDPETAAKFAAELGRAESNSIAVPLARYYASAGRFDDAIDALIRGASYSRSDEKVWRNVFLIYDYMLANSVISADSTDDPMHYAARMKDTYDTLCEVNRQQLDIVRLSTENYMFLNHLLQICVQTDQIPSTLLHVYKDIAFDTAFAPDTDSDHCPDFISADQGTIIWHEDGSCTAETDAVLRLSVLVPESGSYTLTTESDNQQGITGITAAGQTVAFHPESNASDPILRNSPDPFDILISISAGTTLNRVVMAK